MAFTNAHNFQVKNLNATEVHYGGHSVFNELRDAACLGASHQSAERYDPPKCHPDTRAAVINDIMSWVNSSNPKERIMWLNGSAGAGKLSIAQTISEKCYEESKLLSSFFFSRTATGTGRDDGNRLIPTIAYQLAFSLPHTKEAIIAELERNLIVLSHSMDAQIKKLVIDPLAHAITCLEAAGISHIPELVTIDGLDECNQPEVQSMIIKVIAGILSQSPVHLRFIIASRPEREIRKTFNLPSLKHKHIQLTLDESYEPDKDIEVYLQSEFSTLKRMHTLAGELSADSTWPSQRDLQSLVRKSSGQFIYASTVIKFITNDCRDPRDRLKTILNVPAADSSDESPYPQLDALYTHILSTAAREATDGYSSISPIFEALLYAADERYIFNTIDRDTHPIHPVRKLSTLFGINSSIIWLSLVNLHSILFVPALDSPHLQMRLFHASFGDFLKNSSRSKEFFISKEKAHITLAHHCFALILTIKPQIIDGYILPMSDLEEYAVWYYFSHVEASNFDDELLNELQGQNIQSFMHVMRHGRSPQFDREWFSIFILANLFSVRFHGTSDVKIFPKSKKYHNLFNSIFEGVDEFILMQNPWDHCHPIYDGHSIYEAICSIMDGRRDARNFDINLIYDCWLGSLLESPTRGKHLFLNDEKSRLLFRDLCFEVTTSFDIDTSLISYKNTVTVLKYLLDRTTPNADFGIFLKNEISSIMGTLTNNIIDEGFPVEFYLEDAGRLEKQIHTYLKECADLCD